MHKKFVIQQHGLLRLPVQAQLQLAAVQQHIAPQQLQFAAKSGAHCLLHCRRHKAARVRCNHHRLRMAIFAGQRLRARIKQLQAQAVGAGRNVRGNAQQLAAGHERARRPFVCRITRRQLRSSCKCGQARCILQLPAHGEAGRQRRTRAPYRAHFQRRTLRLRIHHCQRVQCNAICPAGCGRRRAPHLRHCVIRSRMLRVRHGLDIACRSVDAKADKHRLARRQCAAQRKREPAQHKLAAALLPGRQCGHICLRVKFVCGVHKLRKKFEVCVGRCIHPPN